MGNFFLESCLKTHRRGLKGRLKAAALFGNDFKSIFELFWSATHRMASPWSRHPPIAKNKGSTPLRVLGKGWHPRIHQQFNNSFEAISGRKRFQRPAQGHPVLLIQKLPQNRFGLRSRGGRPGPSSRQRGTGSNGSIRCHCASIGGILQPGVLIIQNQVIKQPQHKRPTITSKDGRVYRVLKREDVGPFGLLGR